MKRSIAGLAMAALPAAAQFAVPDGLPPLEHGRAVCNSDATHCIVNLKDLAEVMRQRDEAIAAANRAAAAAERAEAQRHECARVEKIPVPGERKL